MATTESRVRLASVKHGIFNPRLPSIRHMDRDTSMHKLPELHCRTSTTLGPDDFKRSTSTILQPGRLKLHHLPITEQGRHLLAHGPSPEYKYSKSDLELVREQWADYLRRCPERFSVVLTQDRSERNVPTFNGYAARYLRPEVTGSWRYTLQQEPSLDQYGQKPVPANIYSRYRDTHPQYTRNTATEAWR